MSRQKTFEEQLRQYTGAIDAALDRALPDQAMPQKKLLDAMRYSLFPGGKRLRPVLLLEFCRICGGNWEDALPFACALEMIHTYSLIHDDLPCMDDDDTRRGQPCCHIAFGEATALLAGSALLSAAFELMLGHRQLFAERAIRAAYVIARASGLHGIAGGQELDLHRTGAVEESVIHERKTAAIFVAAAEAGCILAGSEGKRREAAAHFGHLFGLGFQYADDYQDTILADPRSVYREVALMAYKNALACLRGFEDSGFIASLIGSLSASLDERGAG